MNDRTSRYLNRRSRDQKFTRNNGLSRVLASLLKKIDINLTPSSKFYIYFIYACVSSDVASAFSLSFPGKK